MLVDYLFRLIDCLYKYYLEINYLKKVLMEH